MSEYTQVNIPRLESYRKRLKPSDKAPPFTILSRGKGRRGRRRVLGRPTAGIERLRGLQSVKRFAVIQCPACHEFKIAKHGQGQARCPYCGQRFWLHGLRIFATSDHHKEATVQLQDARRCWLGQVLR